MTKLFTTAKLIPGEKPGDEPVLQIESYHGTYKITQQQLINVLVEEGLMCEDCFDEGEITTDESDGEGHIQRGVGTRTCHCKKRVDDDDRRDDY